MTLEELHKQLGDLLTAGVPQDTQVMFEVDVCGRYQAALNLELTEVRKSAAYERQGNRYVKVDAMTVTSFAMKALVIR